MKTVTLTVNLPDRVSESLADIARHEGRTPEGVAADAITEHVAAALEMRAKVLRGEADAAAGRVVPHEEMMSGLRRIVDAARQARSA